MSWQNISRTYFVIETFITFIFTIEFKHYCKWMKFSLFLHSYVIFRMVNSDLVSLKSAITSTSGAQELIVDNYFNYRVNSLSQLRLRIWSNLSVKVLYLSFSHMSFFLTDHLLYGMFNTWMGTFSGIPIFHKQLYFGPSEF